MQEDGEQDWSHKHPDKEKRTKIQEFCVRLLRVKQSNEAKSSRRAQYSAVQRASLELCRDAVAGSWVSIIMGT